MHLAINTENDDRLNQGFIVPINTLCVIGCAAKYETQPDNSTSLRMRLNVIDWENRKTSTYERVFHSMSGKPIEIICSRYRFEESLYKPIELSTDDTNKPVNAKEIIRSVVPIIKDSPLYAQKTNSVSQQDWPFLRLLTSPLWIPQQSSLTSQTMSAGESVILVLHRTFVLDMTMDSTLSLGHLPSTPIVHFSPTNRTLTIPSLDNLVVDSLYHGIELISSAQSTRTQFTIRVVHADGRVVQSVALPDSFDATTHHWSLVATNLNSTTPHWNRLESLRVGNVSVFSFEPMTSFDYLLFDPFDGQSPYETMIASPVDSSIGPYFDTPFDYLIQINDSISM
jgi:hypothetical protein